MGCWNLFIFNKLEYQTSSPSEITETLQVFLSAPLPTSQTLHSTLVRGLYKKHSSRLTGVFCAQNTLLITVSPLNSEIKVANLLMVM